MDLLETSILLAAIIFVPILIYLIYDTLCEEYHLYNERNKKEMNKMTITLKDKWCGNCDNCIDVYSKGVIVARLCKWDIQQILDGEYLADDMSDVSNCGRWKEKQ